MRNMDEEYCINIRNALTFREGAVRVDAAGNLLSLAVLSEEFYRELLNRLNGWNLKNANSEEKNAPAIDLIDEERKIALQVSLTCDHEKVQRSVEKFKQESYDGWHFCFVPIKRDTPHFRKDFRLPAGLEFDQVQDVYSIDRIMHIIEHAGIDQKREISQLMDKYTKELPAHEALCKRLYDRLVNTRKDHPSFALMGKDGIDKRLFPYAGELLPALGSIGDNVAPIWQHIKAEQREGFRHIVLEGDGGIGKSVSLLSVTEDTELLARIPAVYVHMYDFVYGNRCLTLPEILAREAVHAGIEELCCEGGEPKLMLLLDGLNEVSYEHQNIILRSIKEWAFGHPGAQLIIASRPIPGRHLERILGVQALHISLKGLEENQIRERLAAWELPLPKAGAVIWKTLKLPLFLTLYAKTARLPEKAMDIYPLDVREMTGQASLIWNYLQRELLREAEDNWPVRCAIACEYIAPYMAYRMVRKNIFELDRDEAEQLVREAVGELDLSVLPAHLKRINAERLFGRDKLPETDWIRFVLGQSGIFVPPKPKTEDGAPDKKVENKEQDGEYAFMHQNFRDCLAGLYLVNQAEIAAEEEFLKVWGLRQSYLVLQYAAELIKSEVLDKLWAVNCEIQRYDKSGSEEKHIAICNLLELYKRNAGLRKELDFSGIDLCGLSLVTYLGKGERKLPLFQNHVFLKGTSVDRFVFEGEGHYGNVNALAVLKDGRVISASDDNTLRVWDAATGQCLQILKGHTDSVTCVAALPDGHVVSGSRDKTLRVWDSTKGRCLQSMIGHGSTVSCVAVFPDGRVVSGSWDKDLRIWDPNTGQCLQTISVHKDWVCCVKVLPNGRIISGSRGKNILIWDVAKGECVQSLKHCGPVSCVDVCTDDCIISASASTIYLWDAESGQCIQLLRGHSGFVSCVTFLPAGRVVSGSYDQTLRVWDIKSGQCLTTLEGHKDWIRCVDVLPDGRIVSGSDDNSLRFWDTTVGQCLQALEGHRGSVSCMVALSDNHVACGLNDNTLRIWDCTSGQCIQTLEGQKGLSKCVAVLSDGRIVSGSADRNLRIWDASTSQCLQTLEGHSALVSCVISLPDGQVISGSYDNTIRIWDSNTGKCLKTLEGHKDWIRCIALLPDGRVVSGSSDHSLRVWDASSGECLFSLEGHTATVTCVAVLPDGHIISGSRDNTLRVWDAVTGQALDTLTGHRAWIDSLIVLPNGLVVSGSEDGSLRVWDVATSKCLHALEGHYDYVGCLSLLKDGRVISGSGDGTLRVWDIDTGECLKCIEGHLGCINCMVVLPNGCVVSGAEDNTLRVWDANTGDCLDMLEAMEVRVSKEPEFIMDFTEATLTEDLARLLWHNGAKISDENYERWVKPYRTER